MTYILFIDELSNIRGLVRETIMVVEFKTSHVVYIDFLLKVKVNIWDFDKNQFFKKENSIIKGKKMHKNVGIDMIHAIENEK